MIENEFENSLVFKAFDVFDKNMTSLELSEFKYVFSKNFIWEGHRLAKFGS